METEAAWARAIGSCDVRALDRLAADEFTAVHADGRVLQRDQALRDYVRHTPRNDDTANHEVDIRIYGSTAVVIGRRSNEQHGTLALAPMRFVGVWVLRDARWQLTLEQLTAIG
jgi:ketosteroid isomerase-like protein